MGRKDWNTLIILSIFILVLMNPFASKDQTEFWAKIATWLTLVGFGFLGHYIAKKHIEKYKKERKSLFSLETRGDKIVLGIALFLFAGICVMYTLASFCLI